MPPPSQLELFDPCPRRSTDEIVARMSRRRRVRIDLSVHRNRSTMLSMAFHPGRVLVRMHEGFLEAPDAVIDALDTYARKRSHDAWRIVSAYARTLTTADGPPRVARVRRKGRHFDLGAIYKEVNAAHFNSRLRCRITWGRNARATGRRRRSIRYGSYDATTQLIRIHPALDDARVPEGFVRYIVFHEMLHAVIPAETRNGRHHHHPRAFRQAERAYPDFARMRKIAHELLRVLE